MNRDIKFRAWIRAGDLEEDEENRKYVMLYGDELVFEEYEPIDGLLAGVENLMQYTGLKDIHQKEIYEGDIVKFVAGKTVFGRTFKIVWKGCGFVGEDFAGNNLLIDYNHVDEFSNCEIIGNEFEHPELKL